MLVGHGHKHFFIGTPLKRSMVQLLDQSSRSTKLLPLVSMLLPNLHIGGAERVAVNIANHLIALGYRIDMVLLVAEGDFLTLLDPRVRVVSLKAQRFRWLLPHLIGYLRTHQPNALIANMWPLSGIAVLAKLLARAPTQVIAAEHFTWSDAPALQSTWARWSARILLKRADHVVAVSQGVARDLAQHTHMDTARIKVIYNGIVADHPAKNEKADIDCAWLEGTHKRVIALGSLAQQKNFALLLEAFAQATQSLDAHLLILGEGPERASLEALTQKLALQERVGLPGFSKNTAFYLARADLLVLSSDSEGFGNVLVEALDAGIPVVSTYCMGPREILEEGRWGTLVPIGDALALSHAIQAALTQQHNSRALQGRAQHFSVAHCAEAYLALLEDSRF